MGVFDLTLKPFLQMARSILIKEVKIGVFHSVGFRIAPCSIHALRHGSRLTEAPTVEMVEVSEDASILWIWIPATTPATSWVLHNEVREKLMRFLVDFEGGVYLPRKQHMIVAGQTTNGSSE